MSCQPCMDFWKSLIVISVIMLIVASLYTPTPKA